MQNPQPLVVHRVRSTESSICASARRPFGNGIEHGLSGEPEVSGHEQQIHSRFEGENDDLFIRRRVPHPSHRQRVGHDEAFMPELVAQRARNDGSDRVAGAPSGSRPGKARCPVMITGTRHR